MRQARQALLCGLLLCVCGAAVRGEEILVSAAASLTNAFQEIGRTYHDLHPGETVRFNFGASGALLRQIEAGAPVDVFASASLKEMDTLEKSGGLRPHTRLNFAGNLLALIAPLGSRIRTWHDLAEDPIRHVAISDPASVPSGRYAQETLTRRKLWDDVRPKLVLGENVRQTLAYVVNRDVAAGIVFLTDARIAAGKVRVVQLAESGKDHDPILYPAAVTAHAPHTAAAVRFTAFLRSAKVQEILRRYGFTLPETRPGAAQPAKPTMKLLKKPGRKNSVKTPRR